MEQNLPLVAKKVWSLVRLMLFMLKKSINKRKLLLDINLMIKRGKLAGKALQNLMFNHHHHWSASARSHDGFTIPPSPRGTTEEYEFSCTTTPNYSPSFFKKNHGKKKTGDESDHEIMVDAAMIKALEMVTSAAASPAVLGFGKSPGVRQLRITDSPFPVSNGEEDSYVDEAAEKFIMKFYSQLRRQN